MSGHSYQQAPSSNSGSAYNASLSSSQRPQSSLLLNSVNLAWSQPSGCILVAPRPEPEPEPTPPLAQMSSPQEEASLPSDQQRQSVPGQHNSDHSPTSSVSTVNTSEFGKISSVSLSDFERLSIADSSNLDSASHRAVVGSIESLSAISNDSTSALTSPTLPLQENVVPTQETPGTAPSTPATYKEVDYHWFYQKDPSQKDVWQAFSTYDSYNLEYSFRYGWLDTPIPTNGTRYDVLLRDRTRKPTYWQGPAQTVKRCSWFFKRDSDYRFVPYEEDVAEILESTYRDCFANNTWNRRVDLASHEFVIFYAVDSVYHYISETTNQDGWGAMMETHMTPRYAYRGVWLTNAQVDRDERAPVDHVVFMVHGIGDFCDISFRKLVDVVDDYREITADLVGSHYGHEQSLGRVEVLPISWHSALHTDQLDAHLKLITLPSISRIRNFTNDTIMDALFYTSPLHSQTIRHAVVTELNRIYSVFLARNPFFSGSIGLVGHSLGSLILFDLLSHQTTHHGDLNQTTYPAEQLYFRPSAFFAFGSPIPVFLSVRGTHHLDVHFKLPTCPGFYNIFHPYDPIAYRIEPLIDPESAKLKPVLIPHHKGRKRFHLEIRDSIARMGTELKDKVLTSIKGTIDSIYGFVKAHQRTTEEGAEGEEETAQSAPAIAPIDELPNDESQLSNSLSYADILSPSNNNTDLTEEEKALIGKINFGNLNSGRRIDYVLQERPIEIVNEYLFAIAAHGCYWLSEDTALLMLRELFQDTALPSQLPDASLQTAATPNAVAPQPPPPALPSQTYGSLIEQTTLASVSQGAVEPIPSYAAPASQL